jgi:hypothetical protein
MLTSKRASLQLIANSQHVRLQCTSKSDLHAERIGRLDQTRIPNFVSNESSRVPQDQLSCHAFLHVQHNYFRADGGEIHRPEKQDGCP